MKIEISEQRFENILAQRLKEIKRELLDELNPKFDTMEKRLNFITWFIPIFITLLMFMFTFFKK